MAAAAAVAPPGSVKPPVNLPETVEAEFEDGKAAPGPCCAAGPLDEAPTRGGSGASGGSSPSGTTSGPVDSLSSTTDCEGRDEELGLPAAEGDASCKAEPQGRSPCGCRWSRLHVLLFRVLACVAAVSVLVALCPGLPSWRLAGLDLDVDAFVGIVTGDRSDVEVLPMVARVDVSNPSPLSAVVGPASIRVFYGSTLIGNGTSRTGCIARRSTDSLEVEVQMSIPRDVSEQLVADALAHDFELDMHVEAIAPLQVGLLTLRAWVHCDFRVGTMKLFEKNRENVILSRRCSYLPPL